MRALLLAALLLCGCGGPALSDKQRAEVSDIAADAAADASTEDQASKVADLEARIDELESQVEDLSSRLESVEQ